MKDFKAFVVRGNVVDLAIAVVIGAAFGMVVNALVKDILTPIVAIPGKTNFSELHFTIRHSVFLYGDFINAVISFLSIAAVVFYLVVKPLNVLAERRARGADPETTVKDCPHCLSTIPLGASVCAYCTRDVAAA